MRNVLIFLFVNACVLSAYAQHPALSMTDLVKSTYRVYGPGSNATGFMIQAESGELVFVTAAHVLGKMKGETATLQLRTQSEDSGYTRDPKKLAIRKNGKSLWTKHPRQDVAVISIGDWDQEIPRIPISLLATQEYFEQLHPGTLVRCIGYPHAAHFDPIKEGFPLVRLGCIASFPLVPLKNHPTFLVDFNTFEGDSGGLIAIGQDELKVCGLIHGQHFLDERYDLIYQKGHVRKRLGLSIIVHSQSIRETIDKHLEK